MFNNILVPIDLQSPASAKSVLDFAIKVAAQGSKMTALNIVHELPTYMLAQLPRDLIDNQIKYAQRELDEILSGFDSKIEGKIFRGGIAHSITEYAKKIGSDLIIVGSHDKTTIDYLIGSTAERVVKNALCSVLVVRTQG